MTALLPAEDTTPWAVAGFLIRYLGIVRNCR
jgi:hypothetical protein